MRESRLYFSNWVKLKQRARGEAPIHRS
jgi:hypothetical protein